MDSPTQSYIGVTILRRNKSDETLRNDTVFGEFEASLKVKPCQES